MSNTASNVICLIHELLNGYLFRRCPLKQHCGTQREIEPKLTSTFWISSILQEQGLNSYQVLNYSNVK